MSKFKALGNVVAVKTDGLKKEETTTEQGIIYKESQLDSGICVWSTVYSIGHNVVVKIKEGDVVMWKLGTNDGAHYKDGDFVLDLVPEDVLLVVKDAT